MGAEDPVIIVARIDVGNARRLGKQMPDGDVPTIWVVGEHVRDGRVERKLALVNQPQCGRGRELHRYRGDVEASAKAVGNASLVVRASVRIGKDRPAAARDQNDTGEV